MNLNSITVSEKARLKRLDKTLGKKRLYTLYNYIQLTFRKRQNCMDREQIGGFQELAGGDGGLTTKGHKQTFWDDGNTPSICLDCCDYALCICQNSWHYNLKEDELHLERCDFKKLIQEESIMLNSAEKIDKPFVEN